MNIEKYIKTQHIERFNYIYPFLDNLIKTLEKFNDEELIKNKKIQKKENLIIYLDRIEHDMYLKKKLQELYFVPVITKIQNFDFDINNNTFKDYWILDTFTNDDPTFNSTNITLMYDNYPFLSLIFNHYTKDIILSIRLLGVYKIINFNKFSDIEKDTDTLEIVLTENILDSNNPKLNRFLRYFKEDVYIVKNYEDILFSMLEDCYSCGILNNIPIFNLVCYYNLFKSLNYEVLDDDYNQLNFDHISSVNYIIIISKFKNILNLNLERLNLN